MTTVNYAKYNINYFYIWFITDGDGKVLYLSFIIFINGIPYVYIYWWYFLIFIIYIYL